MPDLKIYRSERMPIMSKGGLMKIVMKIMFMACLMTVLTTPGCIIRDGGGWRHWRGEHNATPAAG
jgi:nitrate reductase alpha subunit